MSSIPETLRSKGLKVTPQRIAILNMLMNTKAHPTAEAIFKALEPTNPTMSLATVYKTLDSFTAADIIQELSIDGESLHYDYNTKFHPHLICRKCGADEYALLSIIIQRTEEKVKRSRPPSGTM